MPEAERAQSAQTAPAEAVKRRVDHLLVERGLAPSRSRAQALIAAGQVVGDGAPIDKPGHMLASDAVLELRGADHPYVSRGGLKLAHALDHFALDPSGATALDIGASTGGFTDVLLQRGARRVFAIDVGHGQLVERLRLDPRVTQLERVNARGLTREMIGVEPDWLVCDASFIGLRTLLPAPLALCGPGALVVALIKPQFEVGRGKLGKGGVVRDPAQHDAVCADIAAWFVETWRAALIGLTPSPLLGPEGNREFLIALRLPQVGH